MAQQTNPVNEPADKRPKSHSRFQPNFSFFHTERYGILNPKFPMETIEGDHIMLRNQDDVDTYTLKAPTMTPVRKVSVHTLTPLRAILPINAERIITNPLQGDDVDAPAVNCGVQYSFLLQKIQNLIGNIPFPTVASGYLVDSTKAKELLDWLVSGGTVLQHYVSSGSLLAALGINLSRLGWINVIEPDTHDSYKSTNWTYDRFYDYICGLLATNIGYFSIKVHTLGPNGSVVSPAANTFVACSSSPYIAEEKRRTITFRRFIELLNEGAFITVEDINSFTDFTINASMSSAMYLRKDGSPASATDFEDYINLSRLAAYQLTQAEFFTNDKVDDVYSTRLYHDNMLSLARLSGITAEASLGYRCNGIWVQYDSISGAIITRILDMIPVAVHSATVQNIAARSYFFNLFGFQRSLRFGDYFAGAKVHPLAIGDVNVGVDTDTATVDVIDITRNIQRQRFLNQVNRVGRKFKDYIKGIFGVEPMPDAHEVQFLGSFTDTIGAEETVNTGSEQREENNRTSNFRSNASRFAFEVTTNEPCIILTVQYYDLPRAYAYGIERAAMHADRYDMFNPFMQTIGDQDVSGVEIDPAQASEFGYQLRYAEYKQRVDRAAGGFYDYLPGYAVLADFPKLSDNDNNPLQINSDFIRCRPSEFDDLYTSLTHYSLAGYFHFIVRSDFEVTADRPMIFAPSIL